MAHDIAALKRCSTEHRNGARGVEPGGIRLSIGLEDRHDIIADLEKALEVV